MGYYELSTWMEQAACTAGVWDTLTPERQQTLCISCPVRGQCLDYADSFEAGKNALDLSEIYGAETHLQRAQRRITGSTKKTYKPRRTTTPELRRPVTCEIHGPTTDVYVLANGRGKCRPCQMEKNRVYREKRREAKRHEVQVGGRR